MKLTKEKLRRLIRETIKESSYSDFFPGYSDDDIVRDAEFKVASIQSSPRYAEIYDVDVAELEEPVAPIATIDLENTPDYMRQISEVFLKLRDEGYDSVFRIYEGDYIDITSVISNPSIVLNLGNMF